MAIGLVKNVNLIPLKIDGRDRERYLQGRITQDVKNLGDGECRQALILSPQGKIEGKFSFSKYQESYLLLVEVADSLSLESFLASLFRFKVADDVVASDLSSDFNMYTLYSPEEINLSCKAELEAKGVILRGLKRNSLFCIDLICPVGISEADLQGDLSLGLSLEEYSKYDLARIKAGYPLVGRDILENTLGPDLDLEAYVSFKKGCYAGQEVIEMSIARGRPNRALVKIESDGAFPEGFDMKFYDQSLVNDVGFVSSYCFDKDADKTFALGFVKTKYEPVGVGYLKGLEMSLKITKSH